MSAILISPLMTRGTRSRPMSRRRTTASTTCAAMARSSSFSVRGMAAPVLRSARQPLWTGTLTSLVIFPRAPDRFGRGFRILHDHFGLRVCGFARFLDGGLDGRFAGLERGRRAAAIGVLPGPVAHADNKMAIAHENFSL